MRLETRPLRLMLYMTGVWRPYLFTETVPIVKLDPYFPMLKRFDYLCSKYDLIPQFDNKTSIEFVQSGEIVGNPFLIVKKAQPPHGQQNL